MAPFSPHCNNAGDWLVVYYRPHPQGQAPCLAACPSCFVPFHVQAFLHPHPHSLPCGPRPGLLLAYQRGGAGRLHPPAPVLEGHGAHARNTVSSPVRQEQLITGDAGGCTKEAGGGHADPGAKSRAARGGCLAPSQEEADAVC